MTGLAAGVMVCIILVLLFPTAWLIGDHRSGRHPLGPAARTVGRVLGAGVLIGAASALAALLGVLVTLGLFSALG